MNVYKKKYLWGFIFFFFAACTTPSMPVENPNIPYQGSLFSVLPPKGLYWGYIENKKKNIHQIIYEKHFGTGSHTSRLATVSEIYLSSKFKGKDELMDFIGNSLLFRSDPRRFHVLNEKIAFDTKFGDYCVLYSAEAEDNVLIENEEEPMRVRIYGYYLVHPDKNKVMITVWFSERNSYISPDFKSAAEEFIDGFELKTNE